ncbi:hypothetical protein [Williamsia sp.]|uniref:hypothetical protein n=1 Tax=Williamsia sp. TaxID=1872085 RepID=UPI001A210485|nr:hypothetical protein [Williamsia sp.]MBJ7291829.1 hypothetical protein [Williamsia sp.]
MHALPDTIATRTRFSRQAATLIGVVIALALLTCAFIVALPLLGSLELAAIILGFLAGAGLATIYALSRL